MRKKKIEKLISHIALTSYVISLAPNVYAVSNLNDSVNKNLIDKVSDGIVGERDELASEDMNNIAKDALEDEFSDLESNIELCDTEESADLNVENVNVNISVKNNKGIEADLPRGKPRGV